MLGPIHISNLVHSVRILYFFFNTFSKGLQENDKKKIAVIGGGIAGTFVAKYITEYDDFCKVDSISIFDPSALGAGYITEDYNHYGDTTDDYFKKWQGSRVASVSLHDGSVIELGASIAFNGNKLLLEVLDNDPHLAAGPPFATGNPIDENLRTTFGIWDGTIEGGLQINTVTLSNWSKTLFLLWRYNVDLIRLLSAVNNALVSFNQIYEILYSDEPGSSFDTPDEMWKSIGLYEPTLVSFEKFLDQLGIAQELPWWRKIIPYQGILREELLTAINLCNYNQLNSELNGLVGLVSFIPSKGELFSVVGGNNQLVSAAFEQAKSTKKKKCNSVKEDIIHIKKIISTVVSSSHDYELWSENELLGSFDVVILAAPLQMSRISFFIRSEFDSAVLLQMPLNGMIDHEMLDANTHQHVSPLLPTSASRPYKQVVTTIVSNASINTSKFRIDDQENLPRSIYFTEGGKSIVGLQSVTQISKSDGLFKIFSTNLLNEEHLNKFFEPGYDVKFVKTWGGLHGGAVPDFAGGGENSKSLPYLLYNGGLKATDIKGHCLFYINTIEAAVSSMEISAIGSKSVAKLLAQRFQLLSPSTEMKDEL